VSLLSALGADVRLVADQVGQSNTRVTLDTYVHVRSDVLSTRTTRDHRVTPWKTCATGGQMRGVISEHARIGRNTAEVAGDTS
jgi:hypothetical protein